MKNYLVSILVPIFRASDFIEKCAESLFSQTFQEIEFIFVDDASPDDSIEKLEKVLEHFPKRKEDVKILRNEKNIGISSSRQKAFDTARGKYFLAMDSDDWIEVDMIEQLFEKAESQKADITYCSYFRTFKDRETIEKPLFTSDKKALIKDALNGKSAYWNKLIRLDLLQKNNIKTISGVNMADDLVVLVKLIYYAQKVAFADKPFYHYVQFNENACTKELPQKHINDHLKVTQNIEQFFQAQQDFSEYETMIMEFKAKRKIKIIRSSMAEKQYLTLYPNINHYLYKLNLPIKSKIILYLAQKEYAFLSKLFLKTLNLMNKITFTTKN